MKNKRINFILPPIIISILTFLFYLPSLHYGFVFDDLPRISQNFHLKNFSLSNLFFVDSRWIAKVLNGFTYSIWKLNPFGYRIINIVMHITIGMLIFTLLYLVFSKLRTKETSPGLRAGASFRQKNIFSYDNTFLQKNAYLISLLTSGLFLLHPAQTQTVTYITQMRLEGLVTFFIFTILLLFSLATFTSSIITKSILLICTLLLTLLASGTKEIIIVLPGILLLFDWFFLAQANTSLFIKRLPLHALLAVALFSTFSLYQKPVSIKDAVTMSVSVANNRGNRLTPTADDQITPYKYLITQFKVILHYLRIYFWPGNMTFDYDVKLAAHFWSMSVIIPLLLLLMIAFITLYFFFYNPLNLFSFCSLWFFGTLLPRASIVPTPELICDYKTYLPSFGLLLLFAFFLTYVFNIIKKSISIHRVFYAMQGFTYALLLPLENILLQFQPVVVPDQSKLYLQQGQAE